MMHVRLNQWPRGRYVRTRLSENTDKGGKEEEEEAGTIYKHALLEMLASIVVTYSALYFPLGEDDYLRQYVPSISIFAVVLTLRDSHYFCPDCTPFTTLMLWVASLYTNVKGTTKWGDILARISGQLIGWALVFIIAALNKENLDLHAAIPSFHNTSHDSIHSSHGLQMVNEGLGTMVECIAITLAIIPLTSPYQDNEGIESKEETDPPKMSKMALVALALAAAHYSFERLFQATMNPLVSLIHLYVKDELAGWYWPIAGQLIGFGLAGVYIYVCQPARSTLAKILEDRKREHGRA